MATVDELALLSKSSYGGDNVSIPSGWIQLKINNKDYFKNDENGFAGALYYNASTYEVVMAIRGTEPTSINDIADDFAIMRGDSFSQKGSLGAFYTAVDGTLKGLGYDSAKKYITGQSLGGTLAQLLGSSQDYGAAGIETVTFDAFGAQYLTGVCTYTPNITNYVVANDPVGTYYFDGHIGNVVLLYPVPMDNSIGSPLYPHNYIPFYNDLSISNFIIPNGAQNWSKEKGLALWFYDKNMNDASAALAIVKGFVKPSLSVLEDAVTYIESLELHPVTLTYDKGDGYYIIGDMTGSGTGTLTGKAGYDSSGFFVDNFNDQIYGNEGNDSIKGLGGNDTIYGDNETEPTDTTAPNCNDSIEGGSGDDLIYGGQGVDKIHGGDNNDTIYGDNEVINQNIDGGDYLYGENGEDNIVGGSGYDVISAGNGNNTIFGGADDDVIISGDGIDIIDGGSGNNMLQGGMGKDIYIIGNSNNTIFGDFSKLRIVKGA